MTTPRITKQELDKIATTLTTSDFTVLKLLADHRFASTDQIAVHMAAEHSPGEHVRRTNHRLNRLADRRLIAHLERRIGGTTAGSTSKVWYLTEPGRRLLSGPPYRLTTRRRHQEPSLVFLAHTLLITDLRTRVEHTLQTHPATALVKVETEPWCWRKHLGPHGAPVTVKPDLALVTTTTGYEDHWWCELDLATERPTRILAKCQVYLQHLNTGAEQQTRGVYPRVLWITPDPDRATQLHALLDGHLDYPVGMFTVCTLDEAVALIANTPLEPEHADTASESTQKLADAHAEDRAA